MADQTTAVASPAFVAPQGVVPAVVAPAPAAAMAANDQNVQDTDGDKPLGPNGEKALARERRLREAAEKALQAKVQEFEDANRTDLEKAQAKADAADKRAAEAELRAVRAEVVAEKGVPSKLAKFITGGSREEIEAAADELMSEIPAGKPAGPKPDPSQGARGDGTASKAEAGIAEAARRFKKSTQ